jgi:hypothetical protein
MMREYHHGNTRHEESCLLEGHQPSEILSDFMQLLSSFSRYESYVLTFQAVPVQAEARSAHNL